MTKRNPPWIATGRKQRAETEALLAQHTDETGQPWTAAASKREYGLGRMRTDLLLVWPVGGQVRKTVIECKLLRGSLERTLRDVLEWTFQVRERL